MKSVQGSIRRERPQILFLAHMLPFPPYSGVTNRSLHVLRELQLEFDVTLIAFSRKNHQPTAQVRSMSQEALAKEVSEVYEPVPIRSESNPWTKLWNHLRSITLRQPYVAYDYSSRTFRRHLQQALSNGPPAVAHLDSLDLYRWARYLRGVPLTCTHHAVESALLRRRAKQARHWLSRAYLMEQARLFEKTERRLCPQFGLNIAMSDLDATRLASIAPGSRIVVIPNGVDIEELRPTSAVLQIPGRLLYLGPPYFTLNLDAIEYFLKEIWPSVRAVRPDASLCIVGACPADIARRLTAHGGVICAGEVADIRLYLEEAVCTIVPLRTGGGTRLKILDAWAMAQPVISTSIGCEGLRATDGHNILIRDTPAAFAEAVVKILKEPRLAHDLGAAGRRTAEQHYGWRAIGNTLRKQYRQLLLR